MEADAQNHVKVCFPLDQDEDGYPPVADESLWVLRESEKVGVVDNVPFFVLNISVGDKVNFSGRGATRDFVGVVDRGGHSTIRIILLVNDVQLEIRDLLEKHGCSFEVWRNRKLLAVDVPSNVDYEKLIEALLLYYNSDKIEIQESCMQHR